MLTVGSWNTRHCVLQTACRPQVSCFKSNRGRFEIRRCGTRIATAIGTFARPQPTRPTRAIAAPRQNGRPDSPPDSPPLGRSTPLGTRSPSPTWIGAAEAIAELHGVPAYPPGIPIRSDAGTHTFAVVLGDVKHTDVEAPRISSKVRRAAELPGLCRPAVCTRLPRRWSCASFCGWGRHCSHRQPF
jgi:hypothetical protein